MKRVLIAPSDGRARLGENELSVAVVGGGIAGLAAACILAERGARVIVYEKERYFGGRAGAWTEQPVGADSFEMERGFHAFFRQYYNLRALLGRVDPALSMLAPVDDYPILAPEGTESFAGLSKHVPVSLAQLVTRTNMRLQDLARIDVRSALAMLQFDGERTYARYDDVTAKAYLDGLRFPTTARRLLFDVFAHSFFNSEAAMSAAEMLMMFHFYFVGNPEGLLFDVARRPFSVALWEPLTRYLAARGVELASAEEVDEVARDRVGLSIRTNAGRHDRVDACVLALSVPGLKQLVAGSPSLGHRGFLSEVEGLAVAPPFAVWRLWLGTPTAQGRSAFAGTTGYGLLDNISLYHLFEDESRTWATRSGGAVVELHAYAIPEGIDDDNVRHQLLDGLHRCYPETRGAPIIAERYMRREDCAAFAPGSWSRRPAVVTGIANLVLAGDFVKLAVPSALMERAATSGMLAANHLLSQRGVAGEPIWSVPPQGVLEPLTHALRRMVRWAS